MHNKFDVKLQQRIQIMIRKKLEFLILPLYSVKIPK